jgi:phage gpG-like protein
MSNPRVVDVKIAGWQEVSRAIAEFGQDVVSGVRNSLNATGLEVLTDVKKAMEDGVKTGREYKKGENRDIIHKASAPGEAPATDDGALVGSIYYNLLGDSAVVIGSRLPYSAMLEFGTLHIAKRPAWIPAAEKNAPRLEKRLARIIAQAKAKAEKTTR